jgi:hypothetical protein
MSTTRIIVPIPCPPSHKSTPIYYTLSGTIFWTPVRLWENLWHFSAIQYNSSHHKQFYALFTECCLWKNSRIICRSMWLPHSPDLNLRNFYLWSMLNDKLCTNNHCRKTIWKENQNVVSSVSTWETGCVMYTLVTCDTFLWGNGNMASKNLLITAIIWNKMHEPWLMVKWNSSRSDQWCRWHTIMTLF